MFWKNAAAARINGKKTELHQRQTGVFVVFVCGKNGRARVQSHRGNLILK